MKKTLLYCFVLLSLPPCLVAMDEQAAQTAQFEIDIAALQEQRAELDAERKEVGKQRREAKSVIKELEGQEGADEAELAKLKAEKDKLRTNYKGLNAQDTTLKARIRALKAQLAQITLLEHAETEATPSATQTLEVDTTQALSSDEEFVNTLFD